MPVLQDPRHEAFAPARARGALLIDAYESAGFVRHRGHPERIAELRALQTEIEDISPLGLLASPRRIIKAGESSENPTLVNAARLAIVDASRPQAELASHHAHERRHLDWYFNDLDAERLADTAQEATPKAAMQRPSPPREAPAAAPGAPRERPFSAPRAPLKRLASAAASPLALPGFSAVPAASLATGKVVKVAAAAGLRT